MSGIGNEQSIKALVRRFVSNGGEVLDIVLCNVVEGSVDTTNWLCDGEPISGDGGALVAGENQVANIIGIQLTAAKGSNGKIPIPADGSQILVLTTVRLDSYAILFSDIVGYGIFIENSDGTYTKLIVGEAETTIPGAGIQMNDGSNGGLVIGESGNNGTDNLQDQLAENNNYINALEQQCAAFAAVIDGIVPGTLANFNSAMAAVKLGDYSKIINKTIVHGK